MKAAPSEQQSLKPDLTSAGGLDDHALAVLHRGLRRSLARLDVFVGARSEISVKDRDAPGQRTTMEVWLPRLPRLVATSDRRELASAAAQLNDKLTAQLDELLGRRQPRNNRKRRHSIRRPGGGRR